MAINVGDATDDPDLWLTNTGASDVNALRSQGIRTRIWSFLCSEVIRGRPTSREALLAL